MGAGCTECDGDHHCSTHGTCKFEANGTPMCECYGGFATLDCSMAMCPLGYAVGKEASVCSGQGECERNAKTGNYECACDRGYGTLDCHAVCPSGPVNGAGFDGEEAVCSGHGYCADANNKDEPGYGAGSCVCDADWQGDKCQIPQCPRSIPRATGGTRPRPCGGLTQGVCQKSVCFCRAGFSPPDCATPECPNDCSGHGVCRSFDETPRCACDAGFDGDDCSKLACAEPTCNGHGKCISARCHCDNNFFGSTCAIDRTNTTTASAAETTCSKLKQWSGHGDCDPDREQCVCDEGFVGKFCQKKECLKDCSGRGTCSDDGVCECEEGYAGRFCQRLACPKDCSGRGYCINGTCFCRMGWEGASCSSRSCKDNCNAMGVCKAGVCACLNGYSGESCEQEPCPGWIGGQQCSGHGICEDTKCTCTGRHPDPFDEVRVD